MKFWKEFTDMASVKSFIDMELKGDTDIKKITITEMKKPRTKMTNYYTEGSGCSTRGTTLIFKYRLTWMVEMKP